jgi:cobalt/nickel transport system permease protein
MHMSDALVSPAVAASAWAASSVVSVLSARALKRDPDDRRVPLMGVLGAFVFAAQMVNFTIPGTGSSGHLGGGLLLAILLGPPAAFLVMVSVLTVQALFFADGGLLALGCNIFNLGFFPSFVAFPLVFLPVAGRTPTRSWLALAAVLASVVGLQLGAFAVVLETRLSGLSSLPFGTFLLLMQPIHLAIGVVEGLVTAAAVIFVRDARPDLVPLAPMPPSLASRRLGRFGGAVLIAAVLLAGVVSWFASSKPDGLEWSIDHAQQQGGVRPPEGALHSFFSRLQSRTGFLADGTERASESWPAVSPRNSLAGLAGAGLTLGLAILIGFGIRAVRRGAGPTPARSLE